jgi:hypothetical protein
VLLGWIAFTIGRRLQNLGVMIGNQTKLSETDPISPPIRRRQIRDAALAISEGVRQLFRRRYHHPELGINYGVFSFTKRKWQAFEE